jgi:ribokinase
MYLGPFASTTWGNLSRSGLERAGVDTSNAPTRECGEQSVSVILVDGPTGQRSILYTTGELADLAPAEVPIDLVTSARALHLEGYHLEAAIHAARAARDAGVVVSFDGGVGGRWPGIENLLPLADLMVVARGFAEVHTGYADPLQAGPALLDAFGPEEVVITAGDRGCWYWGRDSYERLYQPIFKVDVVDTTGAGDVFHGAYLYSHLQGWPARQKLAFASATASLKCQRLGGRVGIPTAAQVTTFLAKNDVRAEELGSWS